MRRRGAVLAVVLLVGLAGCGGPKGEGTPPEASKPQAKAPLPAPVERSELLPVPAPDLARAEGLVLEQITGQQAALEGLLADSGSSPAKLGEAFGDLGLLYVTYSFLDAAEVCFRNAQALMPGDHRWPYSLGYLFQTQGRVAEAKAVLERSLELKRDDLPSIIRLGTLHLEEGENEQAQRYFERGYELNPRSAAVLDGLGKVAAATGETEEAVGYFERALELQPTASSVRHALGLAYRELGDLEKARETLAKSGDALVLFEDPVLSEVAELARSSEFSLVIGAEAMSEGRYEVAAGQYRRALEYEPNNFIARKALGFSLQKLGDLEGAIEQLHLALETGTTGDAEEDALERAEVHRILGGLMVVQGRSAEAIASFRKALELDPSSLDAHLKLGNALAREGRFEEAVGHYDHILGEMPEHADVLVRRATALVNLGRKEAALADFRRAVELAPQNADVRLRYAEALDFLGRPEAAAAERAAVSELPVEDAQRAALLAEEGRKLQRAGRYQDALGSYRRALEANPELLEARYQMATLLGHLGRLDAALAELRQVIEAEPRHAGARRGEVTALLLEGRYAEARQRLTEALSFLPRDSQLAHALARLLAIAPDARVRDGQLAVEIAGKVHAARREGETAQTLAMAYAEVGQLDLALELQRPEAARGGAAGERLAAYERGRPWRASSPEEILIALGVAAGGTGMADRG